MHVIWFMKKFTLRTNHKIIAWLHWVSHYFWGIKKYVILVICITKIKVRKKPMKCIYVENLHRSIFFLMFDSVNAISREATMNETTALQLSTVVGNWLIHGCQILICKKFCILCKLLSSETNSGIPLLCCFIDHTVQSIMVWLVLWALFFQSFISMP